MVYSLSATAIFTASSSSFQCKSAAYVTNEPNLASQTPTIGGAFYIVNAVSFTSTTNTIKWCYLGDTGGAFYLQNTQFWDSGSSTFSYNAAVSGGAITCNACTMLSFKQTTFNNHQGYNGGLMNLISPTTVILDSISVTTSSADNFGGMIYATGTGSSPVATITVKNTYTPTVTWVGLSAAVSGGGFYINHPLLSLSLAVPMSVTNSKALAGTGGFMNLV